MFTFAFKVEKYVFHCGREQCDLNMSLTQNCVPLSDGRALREGTLIPALLILYIRIAYLEISPKKRNTALIYFRHNSTVAARLKNQINAEELCGFPWVLYTKAGLTVNNSICMYAVAKRD
jgi:hypothetical protein